MSLLGDAALTFLVTLFADKFGRKRMLVLGCAFNLVAAILFYLMRRPSFVLIAFTAYIGVVSLGVKLVLSWPFMEESIILDLLCPSVRTTAFAWYLGGWLAQHS